ncbi:MAG: glycosyltransferase family 4 protein [Deferribacteres bacterium]|nr:glycosyltransferase family 4 protein [Deferribacteres bacterium]
MRAGGRLFSCSRYRAPAPAARPAWRSENGIRFVEIMNTPYRPGCLNDPAQQCRRPDIERLVMEVLDDERPDIVHFHELQMHPASVIDIVSARGIPSLKTIHNYYDICPQRDLLYRGEERCYDFDGGTRCTECLSVLPPAAASFGERLARTMLPAWLYTRVAAICPRRRRVPYLAGQYLLRRRFFVERLNRLDAVHCSSPRSAAILADCGVLKSRIRIIPLSVKNLERITPKPLRGNHHPVVFGYVSGRHVSRGYRVLIEAFSMLDQSRARLVIWNMPRTGPLGQGLNVELRRHYMPEQINGAFREMDVGIIPSIWEEIFGIIGIEWLTAGIPVIGSDIGGIPAWLKNGENGFLIPPGDARRLAGAMQLFVNNPALIAQMQQRIRPWNTFSSHVGEMLGCYEDIMASRKRGK